MDSPGAAGFSAAYVLVSLSRSGRGNEQQRAAARPYLATTPIETSILRMKHYLGLTGITAFAINQYRNVETAKLERDVTSPTPGPSSTAQTTTITPTTTATTAHPNPATRKSARRRSRMVRRLCRSLTKYLPRSRWRPWPEAHRLALVDKLAGALCASPQRPCLGGGERAVRARLDRLFLVALAGDAPVDVEFAVYDCLQMERGLDWLMDCVFRAKPMLAPSWWRTRAEHFASLRRLEEQLSDVEEEDEEKEEEEERDSLWELCDDCRMMLLCSNCVGCCPGTLRPCCSRRLCLVCAELLTGHECTTCLTDVDSPDEYEYD
ncbi:hypothetical protein F4809DRAFT_663105 [Biscogniauxia mediterranea]|nr:hypothetical protein F4809DRAFT_663105 [Biscogniauxia mediterranea]